MRHNKFVSWGKFLGVVEQVQKLSPWLSRQIAKRASEWPFWYSGLQIREWGERQAWVTLPHGFRTTIDGEICQGHLVLGAELALRLVLLRLREEFPFRYRILSTQVETHHAVDQDVDCKFSMRFEDWEQIRLQLAKESHHASEFVVQAQLADGRLAGRFAFQAAFELEKFLPA